MTAPAMDREAAERVVDSLLHNLSDRRGFSLDDIDRDTRMELREEWIAIVMQGGNGKRPWWVDYVPGGDE